MNRLVLLTLSMVCSAVWALPANGQMPLLQVGDPILAIDGDEPTEQMRVSEYPGNEAPEFGIDSLTFTKYLNFGTLNTGFIVTPLFGSSQIQSMQFFTANDAEGRDPTSWALWGTNDPITSVEHSDGSAENWSLIAEGDVALPPERETAGPVLSFSNSASYSSYRLVFPTIKDFPAANSMQIGDVSMFESTDGSGSTILSAFDPIIAIQLEPVTTIVPSSSSPAAEGPEFAIDGDAMYERPAGSGMFFLTKYLNFGELNSGFIVTPSAGAATVNSFQITTADDAMERDPATWELYGTNDPVVSENHSQGTGENWTLVDSGTVDLPADRQTAGPTVDVTNSTAYASYKMVFPTVRDEAAANSMQIAGVQFFADDIMPPVGVPGDYNDNGVVDAADYVLWRNGGPIENEVPGVSPGMVTAEDYDAWRARFGNTSGSGSSADSAAVPEPASLILLGIVFAGFPLTVVRQRKTDG